MIDNILNVIYKNKVLVIIVTIILIVIAILLSVMNNNNFNQDLEDDDLITLTLFGNLETSITVGSTYEEAGYYAVSKKGIIKTDLVKVVNNVDTTKPGTYTIIYSIEDVTKTRTVKVVDNENLEENREDIDEVITFELVGYDVITIPVNSGYTELGYNATSNLKGDLKDFVTVSGVVDTGVSGVYTLIYRLNYNDKLYEKVRTVIVSNDNLSISITKNTTNYTNQDIKLTVKVTGDNFSYLTLPNKNTTYEKEIIYNVEGNGDYTFIAHSKTGKTYERVIKIDTIDKTAPTGTCVATIGLTETTIKVTATDAFSKIKSYTYYDNGNIITTTTNPTYSVGRMTSNIVTVKVIDNASNERILVCTIK